jgi:hypothetical protein
MGAELVVVVGMEALDGRVLDRAVHRLELAVGPGVVWLREAMLDTARPCPWTPGGQGLALTDHVEAHGPGNGWGSGFRAARRTNAGVGKNRVNLTGHGLEHVLQELPGCFPVCLLDELAHGKLAPAVNADEQVQLSFSGLNLGEVDMEEADG